MTKDEEKIPAINSKGPTEVFFWGHGFFWRFFGFPPKRPRAFFCKVHVFFFGGG